MALFEPAAAPLQETVRLFSKGVLPMIAVGAVGAVILILLAVAPS